MASTTSPDQTFRSYTSEDAKIYTAHRLSYPEALYNTVLEYHASTGGQFGLLLDLGCGPGNATRDVATSFNEAIGVDPGDAMIVAARDLGGKTKSGKGIRYEVAASEDLSGVEGLERESVDLLISAMAVRGSDCHGDLSLCWRHIGLMGLNSGLKLQKSSNPGGQLLSGLAVSFRSWFKLTVILASLFPRLFKTLARAT